MDLNKSENYAILNAETRIPLPVFPKPLASPSGFPLSGNRISAINLI